MKEPVITTHKTFALSDIGIMWLSRTKYSSTLLS